MKKVAFTTLKFGIPAVVLILTMQVTSKSAHAQKYSDWSAPINLGPTVNSAFADLAPVISKEGLSLYFTSTNRPDGFGGDDIYVSQRNSSDDPWGPPVNLGPTINTSLNERVSALSRDGHLLFFSSNQLGFGNLDIWVSRREHTHDDFAWQPAENLGAGVNSASLEAGASYFENDEVGVPQLYFNSNRPGGPGASNLYLSEQTSDGSFGTAFLVVELSGLNETARASVRHDGREIFFTSNRPGSINTQDLWVATRDTVFDAWSAPINMGPGLNSGPLDVQPYISSDRETLFFASTRPGGVGSTDLYMTTRTKGSEK